MFESIRFRVVCFVAVTSMAVLLSTTTSTNAEEFDADVLQKKIYSTIEAVQPAVVSIRRRGSMFSGVIVSKDGHVLSAGHAVSPGGRYTVILPSGKRYNARGKGSNPQADCALLKISSDVDDLPFVRMGESRNLVNNQPCLSLSFPGGQGSRETPLVRFGRVVKSGRGRGRGRNRGGLLQSTALMEPGDSGGPLFDLQGRVIGIHSRIGESMSRNYEVPIDTYRSFWNELNREQSFTQSGPPVPLLGFQGRDRRDGSGIDVNEIVKDSLAEKHGLQPDDVIQSVFGKKTASIQSLRRALIAARDEDAKEIEVKVLRQKPERPTEDDEGSEDDGDETDGDVNDASDGETEIVLTVPFNVEREAAPKVELPDYAEKEFATPQRIDQLANLPRQFSELESKLDDACVEVVSEFSDGEKLSIVGTRIKSTYFIVSKSSMVAQSPIIEIDDQKQKLEVVARDVANDLVLLKSKIQNSVGIDINAQDDESPITGSFLITPDFNGAGLISVVSTKAFSSRKQRTRGFLGVMPANYQNRGGAILNEVTDDGAAKRAGLKVGDIVTKLNETKIRTHMEMREFLLAIHPNAEVIATITRGDEELEKTIRLGAAPSGSNHAADKMNKSGRLDGFSKVIPHDADLKPADCGGPLFDLEGNFVGLNIARNSRVRSYAIPREVIKQMVEKN